jgi:hypothetical protein
MKYLLLLLAASCVSAQPVDPFNALQFLTGEWVGEGAGSPGQSAGACSFTLDLQGKVLIRKSYAVSTKGRHEDLMVVYLDEASKNLKAVYFDNEGHVIHYTVDAGPDSAVFRNEQYRLTYRKDRADKLAMDFDVAAPGKPFTWASGSEKMGRRPASLARSTSPQLKR